MTQPHTPVWLLSFLHLLTARTPTLPGLHTGQQPIERKKNLLGFAGVVFEGDEVSLQTACEGVCSDTLCLVPHILPTGALALAPPLALPMTEQPLLLHVSPPCERWKLRHACACRLRGSVSA